MTVAVAVVEIRLDQSHSLKDKRQVVRSLMDRVRNLRAVSVCEAADHDLLNVATVGVAAIGVHALDASQSLERALSIFENAPEALAHVIYQQEDSITL